MTSTLPRLPSFAAPGVPQPALAATANGPTPTTAVASASADDFVFDFEEFVASDLGIALVPTRPPPCRSYVRGQTCALGVRCPFRHPPPSRKVVCKHWLRGLCKKSDACEFLHEYNLRKMPECWFFAKYGECSNPECEYRHVDPSSKVRECPWFARGFCRHGPSCKNKHIKKTPCLLYLAGFCPYGKACANGHPKFEVPTVDDDEFHHGSGSGPFGGGGPGAGDDNSNGRLDHIVCFRCGRKGHFANFCPMGRARPPQ
ncbi:RNA-binding component of cleavage and polyadenylation factor [Blastocladiella emersonii ATCC 22665]|nr:RNA-binding component of cleavage and polyadenylation factor [Blastocladiella emersonii ATCC 22665]KAI9175614.1 RNA-binding component of cleavage and polyadenylation factor [Blastocladiella emersonii ATCC 22665]